MVVVSILLSLIVLIAAILIFGGRAQRKEYKRIQKQKREAMKMAKKHEK